MRLARRVMKSRDVGGSRDDLNSGLRVTRLYAPVQAVVQIFGNYATSAYMYSNRSRLGRIGPIKTDLKPTLRGVNPKRLVSSFSGSYPQNLWSIVRRKVSLDSRCAAADRNTLSVKKSKVHIQIQTVHSIPVTASQLSRLCCFITLSPSSKNFRFLIKSMTKLHVVSYALLKQAHQNFIHSN